jgi:uncharacterized pyridoxamine 5'-phosphate oxidase family protein
MKEVLEFLKANPVQYLATTGLDGKPKVRPFLYKLEQGGKLYYCTGNDKSVYREMLKQPWVEISTSNPAYAWIRLTGKVVFSKDMSIKKKIFEDFEIVRTVFQTPENPTFELFFLDPVTAVIADFSGNPPREYSL